MIADAPWILNSYSLWRHPSDVCYEVAEIPETVHFTLIWHATNIQSWNCVNLNDSAAARDFVEFIRTMKSKSRVSTLQQRLVFKSLSKSVFKIAWIQLPGAQFQMKHTYCRPTVLSFRSARSLYESKHLQTGQCCFK